MIPLTGRRLPALLILAALTLFTLLVVDRPGRLVKRWPVLTRSGLALALNLTVVTLAAALLNNQYLFYVSWGDLFGDGQVHDVNVEAKPGPGASATIASPLSVDHSPLVYPKLPKPKQRLQPYTLHGVESGVTGQILVLLPKGYNPAQTYPMVMALAGFPAKPDAAINAYSFTDRFDQLVAQKRVKAPIIVLPQLNSPVNRDTQCVDAPVGVGPQMETWLARDVPRFVYEHFRVSAKRTGWAVTGYASGGWCAAMLAMKHPDVFGLAMPLLPYFSPQFPPDYQPFVDDPGMAGRYNLIALARTRPPSLSMWLMASKQDPISYPELVSFLRVVRPPMNVTTVVPSTGGHDAATIPPVLDRMTTWLAASSPEFKP